MQGRVVRRSRSGSAFVVLLSGATVPARKRPYCTRSRADPTSAREKHDGELRWGRISPACPAGTTIVAAGSWQVIEGHPRSSQSDGRDNLA